MFAGVGERTREGNELYHEMIESGVIKLDTTGSKAALVYGQVSSLVDVSNRDARLVVEILTWMQTLTRVLGR